MTWIPDEYVFKFIYQIVFSLLPLTIYFTVKKYFKYELAFLAGYYFISQPLYIQPMTGLMRQEIGFVFFALMIMSAFKDNLSIPMRKGLFLFFGSLMIMSHYSTSYIAVVLMILSFIAHKIFVFLITRLKGLHRIKKLYDALPINDANISRNIGGFSLIALAAFTFFWNMQFSTTGSNLLYVANRTVMNMKNIFNDDLKSQDTTRYLSLAATANISTQDVIEKYFNSIDPLQAKYPKEFYSTEATASYAAAPYFAPMIPSKLNPSLTHLGVTGAMIFRSMTKILLLPGLLFLLFILYKKHKFDSEYLVITGVCGILLVTILVVPFLSLQYNVDRLFLQILIFLVTAIITALVYIMWFIKDSIKFVVIALLFAFYFMLNMRLDSQILGGEHFVQLYNVGDDYDKFYIHESEVKAAEWLTRNHINKKTIHADKVATLRLYSFGGPNLRPIENDIVPSLIRVDGYVYADYANLITNRTEARALGKNISYTFPSDFLFDNKNTIYNNGTTKIYK
jgi:uncharacterized membrane protein